MNVIAATEPISTPDWTRATMRPTRLERLAGARAGLDEQVGGEIGRDAVACSLVEGGCCVVMMHPPLRLLVAEPRREPRIVLFATPFGVALVDAEPIGLAVPAPDVVLVLRRLGDRREQT